jgi:hypothetical protein
VNDEEDLQQTWDAITPARLTTLRALIPIPRTPLIEDPADYDIQQRDPQHPEEHPCRQIARAAAHDSYDRRR